MGAADRRPRPAVRGRRECSSRWPCSVWAASCASRSPGPCPWWPPSRRGARPRRVRGGGRRRRPRAADQPGRDLRPARRPRPGVLGQPARGPRRAAGHGLRPGGPATRGAARAPGPRALGADRGDVRRRAPPERAPGRRALAGRRCRRRVRAGSTWSSGSRCRRRGRCWSRSRGGDPRSPRPASAPLRPPADVGAFRPPSRQGCAMLRRWSRARAPRWASCPPSASSRRAATRQPRSRQTLDSVARPARECRVEHVVVRRLARPTARWSCCSRRPGGPPGPLSPT